MNQNKKKRFNIFSSILALSIFLGASHSMAVDGMSLPIPSQIPDLQEQISTDVTPNSPKPGDEINIKLSAFGTDLNAANISWKVDGSTVKSGKGATSIKVTAGKAGVVMTITATIEPLNGNTITKIFKINPATVDIIWESRVYVPPFYKGKALYSPQENVVFVAMPNLTSPNGTVTNPSKVTYTWRQNAQVVGDRSGYGVSSFLYKGIALASPVIIDVEVKDENGLNAESYINISPTDTIMGLYENSPLYGILFNKELSRGFDFGDKEERTVSAYPYYFGIGGKNDTDLAYTWTINGNRIDVSEAQYEMTLRNSNNQSGRSILGSSITNNANILEGAAAESSINFVKPSKTFPL